MMLLLLALALMSPVHGVHGQEQDTVYIPPKPLRRGEAVWPHLDTGCEPMMIRSGTTDLDTYPDWTTNNVPKVTRHRLARETRKILETIKLYPTHDDYGPMLIVELDISLANKVFFTTVSFERSLQLPNTKRTIRANVWHRQTYGLNIEDPEVAVDKTLDYVKKFVSLYLAMNECGEGPGD
ncbi:MAG: hypothetical protein OXT71_10845 [Acidobacteriota bacterium]|nr:hypothetical protein [Acidobacteriota bacterium]